MPGRERDELTRLAARVRRRDPAACLGTLALLLLLPFLAGLFPIVRFTRERIDIAVYPAEIQVAGLYVYRNPWPVPVAQGFTVPFPVDADHPVPTELTVTSLSPDAGPLPVRSMLGRPGFEVRFGPFEEIQVAVSYRQFAPTRDARYLLTTTQPWRRPLEHGLYTLSLHGVVLLGSSYRLRQEAQGLLAFEQTAFMPGEDWHFSWEAAGGDGDRQEGRS